MNILLAAMSLDIGGAETHVVSLAKELKNMGHNPVVVSAGGVYVEELKKFKIKHFNAPLNKKDIRNITISIKILSKLVKEMKVELIHAHGRIPALNGKIVSLLKGISFMTTAHAKFKVSLLYKYTSFWGKEVISVSEDITKHLVNRFNVNPKRITLISNGIDTSMFAPGLDISELKKEMNFRDDTLKIVYVGRISGTLAELVKMIIETGKEISSENDKIEIFVVGDGDDFNDICTLAEEVNFQQSNKLIHVLGKRTDIPRIFSMSDLAICVSRAALEAMACEKPVILAGGEGYMGLLTQNNMDAAISNNFTGRTSSKEITVDKLKSEILSILHPSNEEKRVELGQLGRKVVLEDFAIKAMVEKTVEIYKKLLKGV